jgi:undecaprenyl diphosphate synthase
MMTHDHGVRNLPTAALHVAIIMDGSGRWAAERGLPRIEGYRAGRATVRRTVVAGIERGVSVLTLFAFSTENWGRPQKEVAELMNTFEAFFCVDAPALAARGVRLTVVGRRDRLPLSLRGAIEEAEATSAARDRMHVRLAIDYSGRDAILHAARQFRPTNEGSIEEFARLLAEPAPAGESIADIDLLIRTGGELRLSNCPLWEIAYAELYFTPCLWPDFGAAELDAAMRDFETRHRRFGRIPEMEPEAVAE